MHKEAKVGHRIGTGLKIDKTDTNSQTTQTDKLRKVKVMEETIQGGERVKIKSLPN